MVLQIGTFATVPMLVVSLAREPFVAPPDLERGEGRDEHVGGRLGGPDAR